MSYAHTQIAHIAAMGQDRCIGKDNQLPWHISEDLKRFKALTTAETDAYADSGVKGIVIMGRKTFESMQAKPLPNRVNFILTTQLDYAEKKGLLDTPNVHVLHNLDDALTHAANIAHGLKFETIWIIGGEKVFKRAMMFTDRIELTQIDVKIAGGDAFYPEIPAVFDKTAESESYKDEKSGLSYQFVTYMRSQR